MTTRTPGETKKQMKDMIDGLATPPGGLTSLSVLGVSYAMSELSQKVGTYYATYDATDAAEQKWAEAVEARDEMAPEAEEFVAAARQAFKAALGRKAPSLKEVGIEPEKTPTPLTTEQQAARIAKAKATRIARHTMGKKAKSKIKGAPPAPPAGP